MVPIACLVWELKQMAVPLAPDHGTPAENHCLQS